MLKFLAILIVATVVFGTSGYFAYQLFIRPQIELKREKEAPATPPPPDASLPEFERCVTLKRTGKLIEARSAFYTFIEQNPISTRLDDARTELGDLNTRIYFSSIQTPEKSVYVVRSGDVIGRVAQKNKTSPELIMRANGLTASMLHVQQRLLIPSGNFTLLISRKQNKVIVSNGGRFFKQYPILSLPPQLIPKKGAPPQPRQTGKVIDKVAWVNGARVSYTDKSYFSSTHWINIMPRACTLYAAAPPGTDPSHVARPPAGIALAPQATAELAALLNRGTPVTLE